MILNSHPKLIKIAKDLKSKGRPVFAVLFGGRRTPIVVGARDGVFDRDAAVKLARTRKKEGGDAVVRVWRLKGDALARANRGEWIKDINADGDIAPRSMPGFGPPLKD